LPHGSADGAPGHVQRPGDGDPNAPRLTTSADGPSPSRRPGMGRRTGRHLPLREKECLPRANCCPCCRLPGCPHPVSARMHWPRCSRRVSGRWSCWPPTAPLAAIAARLGLSVRMVDNYLSRTYAKLGVSSPADLAALLAVRAERRCALLTGTRLEVTDPTGRGCLATYQCLPVQSTSQLQRRSDTPRTSEARTPKSTPHNT
jgi:hypothetical protein